MPLLLPLAILGVAEIESQHGAIDVLVNNAGVGFSGPVETKEDIDKIPAEVRVRFEKLQQNDLPSVMATDKNGNDEDADDADDADDDEDGMSGPEQISFQPFSHGLDVSHGFDLNTKLRRAS